MLRVRAGWAAYLLKLEPDALDGDQHRIRILGDGNRYDARTVRQLCGGSPARGQPGKQDDKSAHMALLARL